MIHNLRVSAMFVAASAAAVLTAELAFANPRIARAQVAPMSVTIDRDGIATTVRTTATDVASFLTEQGIALASDDFVSLPPDAPLSDAMRLELRTARDIAVRVDGRFQTIHSGAPTVAAAILGAGITLGKHDEIMPALGAEPGAIIDIVRVKTWMRTQVVRIAGGTRHSRYRYVQRGGQHPTRTLVWSRVVHARTARMMLGAAMQMMATAYTASCAGCSGVAALGMAAGHGIVAVDPAIIPLGTRLYIPGYGSALAGDTGGEIKGSRIDLGFNSYSEAMHFGRRSITVYLLR